MPPTIKEKRKDCLPEPPPCPCPDNPANPAELPVERNRYFTGKYMTARDFRDEQAYFLGRHRLHQWALHGWGIVVGLDVCLHPNPECRDKGWLVITPGIAVDCYGREIVLNEPVSVKIDQIFHDDVPCGQEAEFGTHCEKLGIDKPFQPPEPSPQPPKRRADGEDQNDGTDDDCDDDDSNENTYLLGIRYGEACVEPVPLLYDESNCGRHETYNRIRENPCIRYRKDDNEPGCWLTDLPSDCEPKPCLSPCKDLSHAGEVLKPDCPCGGSGFVPLARFRFTRNDETGQIVVKPYLEFDGRRYLPGPLHPHTLTHICKINWEHNGTTPISELEQAYLELSDAEKQADQVGDAGQVPHHDCDSIRLKITFDDALHNKMPGDEEGHGFYSAFLQVYYEEADGDREPCEIERVHLSECRRHLHCDIGKRRWIKRAHDKVSMHVTLNCDFLLDRKGRPVDGEHLRGRLPSGNGIEGGIFQSWFVIDL